MHPYHENHARCYGDDCVDGRLHRACCIKICILVLIITASGFGQKKIGNGALTLESKNRIGAYTGMGIHIISASSIVKFINAEGPASGQVTEWGTAIEFFGGIEFPVSNSWALKVEHSYIFKSYTLDVGMWNKELHYNLHAPMLMAQYVIPGKGYFVKLSGGGGYHWGTVTYPPPITGVLVYRAHGLGMRAEAEGHTAFDANLFGYISASIGFEALGKVKSDSGLNLINPSGIVSLNCMSAGIRFGLMYYIYG